MSLCTSCGKSEATPLDPRCRRCRFYERGGAGSDIERMSVSMPYDTYQLLCAVIPKGERSGWVARLVQRELEGK